ncbi:hypothetical protein [Salinibacterium sp. ZJ450]|uniref:hypothetical protein n=1 Tax=Salinibacterium sp. ZJ450 TaxID=2708338 RepID=UPI00141FFD0C|nr:hypothetical protein [Salinibacterium sp. ZJ450]
MRRRLITLTLAGTLLLAGCASNQPTFDPAAAEDLQAGVLSVSEASASGDLQGALTRLDELTVAVNDALARGAITPERHQAIVSAIDLVRADLAAAIEAAKPKPTPTPTPTQSDDEDDNDGEGNENGKNDKDDKKDEKKDEKKNDKSDGDSESTPTPTETSNNTPTPTNSDEWTDDGSDDGE